MNMGKHLHRCGVVCILLALCIILCINVYAEQSLHWYCKRTADHTQPSIDSNMQWISELGGIYLDKKHVTPDQDKVVYLTFDVGYENGNVEKILNVMREQQVRGAFFILGNVIARNPELVKRMADDGHLVCNHTYSHKNITTMSADAIKAELSKLECAYSELTGKQMDKFFRPPEGTFDHSSLQAVANNGYKTVFWSFAYADWDNNNQMSAAAAKKKIFDNLHNGEIMLLHPTSATNAEIMNDMICELRSQGYRFGTLDELDFEAT